MINSVKLIIFKLLKLQNNWCEILRKHFPYGDMSTSDWLLFLYHIFLFLFFYLDSSYKSQAPSLPLHFTRAHTQEPPFSWLINVKKEREQEKQQSGSILLTKHFANCRHQKFDKKISRKIK